MQLVLQPQVWIAAVQACNSVPEDEKVDEASVHQCVQINGPLCICAAVLSSVWDQAGPGGMARVKRMHTICVRMLHWWLGKCGSIPLGQFEVIGNSTDRCTVHAFHVAVIITCDDESSCTVDLLASSFALDLNCISITCRPLNFQSFRPRSDNNCVINQIEVTGSVSRDSVCTSTCCMASPASLSFHCAGSEPKPEDSTIFRMSSSPVLF